MSLYKDKIDKLYLELKNNEDIFIIVQNFIREAPMEVFVSSDYYKVFEYFVMGDNVIGKGILWSSEDDLNFIRDICKKNQLNPIISGEVLDFINGKFRMFTRLLKTKVSLEDDFDYDFLAIRLLQLSAISYFSSIFEFTFKNTAFEDIESLSLADCILVYYDSKEFDNVLSDPAISFFTYHMLNNSKLGKLDTIDECNFLRRREELINEIKKEISNIEFILFKRKMSTKDKKIQQGYTINDVDLMDGKEFEIFVAKLFEKMGYKTEVTKHSGDYGIDIIAAKDGIRIGIQAKCYSGQVSTSAIQEVVGGLKYYYCDKGVVVTNSCFTKHAIKLADINNIKLWNRKVLEEKINQVFAE